jgi:hypothetical protein
MEGGCSAFEVTLDEVQEAEDLPINLPTTADYLTAHNWLNKSCKKLRKMPLRKGIPPDDVPTEALRILLCEDGLRAPTRAVGSIGITHSKDTEAIRVRGLRVLRRMFLDFYANIACNSRLPWQHNLCHAWMLSKGNSATGCKAIRLVFGVLAIAKLLLAVLFEIAMPKKEMPLPDFVFHVWHRRREEAIAIQLINGYRLAAAGVSYLRNYRDTCNAFLSISHECVLSPLDSIEPACVHDPITDHVQQNLFRIEVGGETAYLRADCGVFPGSSVGNHLFGLGAWPVQHDWIKKTSRHWLCFPS